MHQSNVSSDNSNLNCIVWDTLCPHIDGCVSRNKLKLSNVLSLKSNHNHINIPDIASNLIIGISHFLESRGISEIRTNSVMHFINNGIGSHLDNTFLKCDNSKNKSNVILKRYINNIFKLQKILHALKSMKDEKLSGFIDILHEKYVNKDYLLPLSAFIRLLNVTNQ